MLDLSLQAFSRCTSKIGVIYKYFKRSKLSEALKDDDSLTIKEKETIAEELRKSEDTNRRCQKYCKWTHGQRAEIGEHVAQHGNAETVRLLGGKYPGLKRQTVSDFKLAYLALKKK